MSSTAGTYEPREIEADIYRTWEEHGCFDADPDPARPPYTIVIPPPNVTGALHLGHALNNTLQDILIRVHRMRGFNACWLPGTDHAGIATQAVVEKRLRQEEGKTRHEIGREALVQKIWDWKEEYNARILNQLRTMGCSCDWRRTHFTLDEDCVRAVYETFFRFFRDGLIYRGLRLVNWDTQLQTAVADDEIVHETVKGHLWHIRYPILRERGTGSGEQPPGGTGGRNGTGGTGVSPVEDIEQAVRRAAAEGARPGQDYLVVATTRPETMLGDTAVAVHPEDERFQQLIGQACLLPLMNRPIPIIADGLLVKREFGTGCVKVTPAHDPNDYAFGQRHDEELKAYGPPMINILTLDGRINERGGAYEGLERYAARKKVVADLEALGLIEKVEPYETEIGHSDRSKTPIEPMLSEQWFVKMEQSEEELRAAEEAGRRPVRLAELALEAVRDGRVQFFPERFAKTYLDWLGEKRDWCISRQLWWGHRIPVWSKRMSREEFRELSERDTHATTLVGDSREFAVVVVRDDGKRFAVAGSEVSYEQLAAMRDSTGPGEQLNWLVCLRDPNATVTRLKRDTSWEPPGSEEILLKDWLESLGFQQDPDVLDTWFSSALWPHSTFGWPESAGDHAIELNGDRSIEPNRDRKGAGLETEDARDPESPLPDGRGSAAHPLPHGRGSDTHGRGTDLTDLSYFYPTNVLSTARDIITLWVARMVMTGLYNMGEIPFPHVYIHPTLQDAQGRRMSKMAGNGVDPLELIELYGADAMRLTLAGLAGETQDIRIPVTPTQLPDGRTVNSSERFELGRNYCNKLWQAATGFILPNVAGHTPRVLTREDLEIEDHWILSRLSACIEECDRRLAKYQFSDMCGALYNFFWSELCDWYIELVKPRLYGGSQGATEARSHEGGSGSDGATERPSDVGGRESRETTSGSHGTGEQEPGGTGVPPVHGGAENGDRTAEVARQVLTWVLDQTLRLFHPIMPFVTETIWAKLNETVPRRGLGAGAGSGTGADASRGDAAPSSEVVPDASTADGPAGAIPDVAAASPLLIRAPWPSAAGWRREADVEADMEHLQNVIRALRDIRARVNVIRAQSKQGSIRTLPQAVIRAAAPIADPLRRRVAVLQRLGGCDAFEIGPNVGKPAGSFSTIFASIEVYVPVGELADLAVERKRLEKERDEVAGHVRRVEGKLSNQGFVSKAPAEVVEAERSRLAELKERTAKIEANLAELSK